MIHTVKGFGIVNKAEIDIFLKLSSFFHDPVDVGNLISGSSAFSKTSLNIWKFKAWRILSITLLACEMSAIVWQFDRKGKFLYIRYIPHLKKQGIFFSDWNFYQNT